MAKILSIEERQVRDSEFIGEFIENGGNATQAAKAVGVSDVSASTVGYRMKHRLMSQIETAQKEALKGYAVKAISQLRNLAENAVNENVRLNANRDLLDRAGYKPVEKTEVVSVLDDLTDEELRAELDALQRNWLKGQGMKLMEA